MSNDAFFLGGGRGINGRETPKTFPACVKGCVLCIFQKGRLVKRGIACRFQGKLTHGSSVGRPLSVLACRHSAWDDEQLQKEGRRIVHSSLRPHLRCDTLPSPLSTSPPQQKKGAVTSHDNLAWFYILFFSFFFCSNGLLINARTAVAAVWSKHTVNYCRPLRIHALCTDICFLIGFSGNCFVFLLQPRVGP